VLRWSHDVTYVTVQPVPVAALAGAR
jgi:hypothetical protein